MIDVFLDAQSLGIRNRLELAGVRVHDDSEIRGSDDTSIGVPDEAILEFLSAHNQFQLVTKDRGLGKKAAERGLQVVFVDETETIAKEVLKRLAISLPEVRRRLSCALSRFLGNDSYLLAADANERTMTHKLAEYLQQEFQGWNVDCEYNRDRADVKRLELPKDGVSFEDLEAKTVFPDIIVHQRGTRENLLVIEAKKSSSKVQDEFDRGKLVQFKADPFNYRYALFIKFNVGATAGTTPHVEWVTNDNPRHE